MWFSPLTIAGGWFDPTAEASGWLNQDAISDEIAAYDLTTGSLPSGMALTRTSSPSASYINSSGVLTWNSAGTARFDYTTGTSCLLVEPAGANLATVPFTDLSFASGSGVPGGFGPDGATFKTVWTDTDGGLFLYRNTGDTGIIVAGDTYAVSAWIASSASMVPPKFAYLDYTGGTWRDYKNNTYPYAGNGLGSNATLARYCQVFTPAVAGYSTVNFAVLGNNTGGTITGWGWQYERGPLPTSYMVPGTTRPADVCTFTAPSGAQSVIYVFDDNSFEIRACAAGSNTVPTDLRRHAICTILIYARPAVFLYKGASWSSRYKGLGSAALFKGISNLHP